MSQRIDFHPYRGKQVRIKIQNRDKYIREAKLYLRWKKQLNAVSILGVVWIISLILGLAFPGTKFLVWCIISIYFTILVWGMTVCFKVSEHREKYKTLKYGRNRNRDRKNS